MSMKQRIAGSRLVRKLIESIAFRAADLLRDGTLTPLAVEQAAQLLRAEYTVMPRFGFHQPIDYLKDSPPPNFGTVIRLPSEELPLPAAVDRMGYPADDGEYLEMGRYDAGLVREQIEKHLGLRPAYAILDFGCSTGRVLRHFHTDHKLHGWRLYGVDIQAHCIEWLRRYFPTEFTVYTGTVLPFLPFEDNSLDVIYGVSVFTHIKYLWDMWLLELRRVLKPGGILIQTIHTEHAWEFYHRHRGEDWVRANHSPRVYETPTMDLDWFHYGDIAVSQAFWKRDIARQFWGRYLEVLDVLPPPERFSFQDWMICRKRR
jgi:SAM-dependent methyltransferase